MKKFRFLLVIINIISVNVAISQEMAVQWAKCYGGSGNDQLYAVDKTTDGGYVMTGWTDSNDGDVVGNHGGYDFWVVKVDEVGSIEWQRCIGGTSNDLVQSIFQTIDGGYLVSGQTFSDDGDVSGYNGGGDAWLVKLNNVGIIEWQKCYGGSDDSRVTHISQTNDGGYILAGTAYSSEGGVNATQFDAWVAKIDNIGNIAWQKYFAGNLTDEAYSVQQTTDSGYVVLITTRSSDGDFIGSHGALNPWVVKLNFSGEIEWKKCYGGTADDGANHIEQIYNQGYVLIGWTESNNGDVYGNNGDNDVWFVRLDSLGNIMSQNCLGGGNSDSANSFSKTSDVCYLVAGSSNSNDVDVEGNIGFYDALVMKLVSSGNILWQKCLGGTGYDRAVMALETSDGGVIVGCFTESVDFHVSGHHGSEDFWLVKLGEANVSGLVFDDENRNELLDSGEPGLEGHLVKIEPGPIYSFTDCEGKYYFKTEDGNHSVSYLPENYWYTTTDSEIQFTLIDPGVMLDTLDFGVALLEDVIDVAVYLAGSPTRPDFETFYWIVYKNWGTIPAEGTINFEYDPLLSFNYAMQTPDSHIDNLISWNYGPIEPGEQNAILVSFQAPGFEYLGDTLISNASITPFDIDTIDSNNYDTIYQEITGSYDPNDKRVTPIGYSTEGYVLHGQKLNYTIRFQNTGNDTAFTVIVKDALDLTSMDIETFNVEGFSHPVTWQLKNPNVIEFSFNNILLPDSSVNEIASHGFVRYSISPKAELEDNTVVNNSAEIYFDFNPPIVTNTTENTYVSFLPFTISEHVYTDLNMSVYPNPAIEELNINFEKDGLKNIIVKNVMGQTLIQTDFTEKTFSLDISEFKKGLYFIIITDDSKESYFKIIKE